MSTPVDNTFIQFLALQGILTSGEMLRTTFDYDSNGNAIYIGISPKFDADDALAVWYIIKMTYVLISGKYYVQDMFTPNSGIKFGYIWNDRTTYF